MKLNIDSQQNFVIKVGYIPPNWSMSFDSY